MVPRTALAKRITAIAGLLKKFADANQGDLSDIQKRYLY